MRLLLLTGPGGDAQGWGDLSVTQAVADAAAACGHAAKIAWVETDSDFQNVIRGGSFDLVWSALYYITPNEKFIGRNESGTWVADVFDQKGIPYIGSNSQAMKDMIDKYQTHTILARAGVAVPEHRLVRASDDVSTLRYPAFVKPMCESRSVGINENSVVRNVEELRRQVGFVEQEFNEPALVEEFLPGDEYTVLVLGNTNDRECLPGLVTVEEHQVMGGAGSAVCEALANSGFGNKVLLLGLPDRFVDHGDPARLLTALGLDAEGIRASIERVKSGQ